MSIVLTALSPLVSTATQLLSSASFDVTVILFGIGVPFLMGQLSYKLFHKSVAQSIDDNSTDISAKLHHRQWQRWSKED